MCGFVAALGTFDLKSPMRQLMYRGMRGRIMDTTAGSVAHVRLPIVGLGTEFDQPVRHQDDVIAFVGEILDFRATDSSAECDLATVVRSWDHLQHHDGFWSIVVLDTQAHELHIVCDYLAQKPTYYRTDVPSAASELNPLLDFGPTTPDEIYFSSVIKWGYCPETRRTPYREIHRVLPGEHVTLDETGLVNREITDPLLPIYGADLRVELELAIRRRVLSSDVSVAALVSGGLDSTIVHRLASRYGDVHPYHVENGEEHIPDGVDVLPFADVSLERALDYMQEPIDLGSLIPQVALSDAIADREVVCLTGDGADEFFGGYGRAMRYDSQASDVWHELVAWHLPRLDRVMMRNRIEVRSPFLARRVAGIALGLPWDRRRDKWILREIFRQEFPDVVDRPKKPLRIAGDREARSIELVRMFRS